MKLLSLTRPLISSAFALIALGASVGIANAEEQYSFKVHNKSSNKIKSILVSEDGKKYGSFNIGSGIAAGKTVKLVWDKSTNSEGCKQYVKAVYEDGEETKPAKFDFCDEDLEIEFE